MNFDVIAPNLNNLGRIHIYLLHLFLLVDYGYCRREFLAQQPQKPELAVGMLRKFLWIFPSAFTLGQVPAMTIFLLR